MHARTVTLLALLTGLAIHTGCSAFESSAPPAAPPTVTVTRLSR